MAGGDDVVSARVFVDGVEVEEVPCEYGCGSCCSGEREVGIC